MSLAEGTFELTDIQNPKVGGLIEERVEGVPFKELLIEMLDEKTFAGIKNNGARFDEDRAFNISSDGTIIDSDRIRFDRDSYFLEVERNGRKKRFFTIESGQGLLVASKGSGAGFITEDESLGWGIQDSIFNDIESFLRGEFDLTDRTHLFEHDEHVYRVPSYSDIVQEDGDIPRSERQFLSSGDFKPAYEDDEGGSGLWLGNKYGFSGNIGDNHVTVDNIVELEYIPDFSRIEPQNNALDISDLDSYDNLDLDLLADQVLELASEEEDGLAQTTAEEQNLLAFKKNSDESKLEVLGAGEHNLRFTEQVRAIVEERLHSGNDVSDLMGRLGRMVENPFRDDRFEGHEVGYWEAGGDLRLYTYTPRGADETFVLEAGSHQDVQSFYQYNNPSDLADLLVERKATDEMREDIAEHGPEIESWGASTIEGAFGYRDNEGVMQTFESTDFDYLDEVLKDTGYNVESIDAVKEFLEENITSYLSVKPDVSEFYKFARENELDVAESYEGDYERVDLIVEGSLEDLQMLSDTDITDSIDPEAEFNEIHINEGLSVNLRFKD